MRKYGCRAGSGRGPTLHCPCHKQQAKAALKATAHNIGSTSMWKCLFDALMLTEPRVLIHFLSFFGHGSASRWWPCVEAQASANTCVPLQGGSRGQVGGQIGKASWRA